MDQYVIASKVISVTLQGKVYEKKDKKVFTEKDFPKMDLISAYEAGFLEKKPNVVEKSNVNKKSVDNKKKIVE